LGFFSGKPTNSQEVSAYDKFVYLEAPISSLGEPLSLWATNYHLPQIEDGNGEIPLRNFKGEELGPKLSLEEWCRSALEGSVRIILKNGEAKTYNYDSTTELFENDCSSFFAYKLGKTKFRLAKGSYGDGVGKYKLTPYRTVATDPLIIPPGTVLYIPDAKGSKIKLKNGQTIIHDGYFFAGDGGGAIKLNHIDVFIGQHNESSFFSWISNVSTITFRAYIVKDQNIIDELAKLHLRIH
jgi:3D (Asp-Asp-Asp) domain-containing protein